MPDSAPDTRRENQGGLGRRLPAVAWSAGTACAVIITVLLVAKVGSQAYSMLGYADPGALTKFGVNLLRLTFDLAGAACLGGLAFCAFFTRPQRDGLVSPDGYAALRLAETAGWVWFGSSLLMIVFDAANAAGQPVSGVIEPRALLGLIDAIDAPKAWLVSAGLVLIVASSCRLTFRWRPCVGLTAVAMSALIPPVLVSHSASNSGHDFASDALSLHVIAAAMWLGSLFAVLAHVHRRGAHIETVARRYRRLSGVCWIVVAVSGAIDSLVLIAPGRLPSTGYWVLVAAKLGCLLAIGAVVLLARGRIDRVRTSSTRTRLMRLAAVELILLLTTVGVSMGMAQQPPPNLLDGNTTAADVVIGYNLPAPPTLWQLATLWRFDLIIGTAAVVLAVSYAVGVRRLRARGSAWPRFRTSAWMGGCAALLIASSSGVGSYAPSVFGVHMVAHLLLNLLGPALLVLGAPVTLGLRVSKPARDDEPYGPREWLLAVVDSAPARALTHPVVTTLLLVGSLYALYPTGLFERIMQEHWAHTLLNVYFVLTGYLWFWSVLGTDRAPRRVPQLARLGITLGMMPLLAFFGVLLLSIPKIIAENYYRTLDLPWSVNLEVSQRIGALIGWLGGEVPLLLALVVLLWQWHLDQRGDEDSDAHDSMIAELTASRKH